ncbi:MAG: CHASE2 domain-containing protein [Phycisphaerales bacterium]|nr:CHASE2 domain-containing protein [Phycisphaerales bacterium]
MTNRERTARRWAFLIGIAATLAACLAYSTRVLERAELRALDLRFRYANSIPHSDELVRIDIDDSSVETVGRWPWARFKQSCLVEIPAELGARAVVVDLEYLDGQPLDIDDRRVDDGYFDPLSEQLGPESLRPSDLELRAAIAGAGNVYLAFHAHTRAPLDSLAHAELVDALHASLRAGASPRDPKLRTGALQYVKPPRGGWTEADVDQAVLIAMLAAERDAPILGTQGFDTTPQVLAVVAGLEVEFVERIHSRCLEAAARRLVRGALANDASLLPLATVDLFERLLPRVSRDPPDNDTPRTEALGRAIRHVRSAFATRAHAYSPDAGLAAAAAGFDAIQPVLYEFASAARRCGFVVFEPDSDGVARRVSLLATVGDGLTFPQLALGCAADLLSATHGRAADGIRFDPQRRRLHVADRVIQLDAAGRAIVPWVADRDAEAAGRRHVPAEALFRVQQRRRDVEENRRIIRDTLERIFASEFFPDHDEYVEALGRYKALHAEADRARLVGSAQGLELHAAAESARVQVEERERLMWEYVLEEERRLEGLDASARTFADERSAGLLELFHQTIADRVLPARAANESLGREIAAAMDVLRSRIAGRTCVVGYTATALADMTPTPTSRRAPGVLAHYWLLNGLLVNRMVYWTTPLQNLGLTFAAGLLATLIAVWRGPRGAALVVGILALTYTAASAVTFYVATTAIAIVPPLVAMFAALGMIAFHRYMFVERERRELATALTQYTSRAIARQVAENPELCRRAESREVSVIFTDLRGFTQIAERIGADRTQRVLNLCLERCTGVLVRHEAMVNKFMGDGIFAFWNPVIYPQSDHARRACESAADLQAAMAALAREQSARGGDPVFAELVTRVGIATGNAVVGPCGSAMKYDYTCIGDSVNVAARLESANKFFGTLMLVNDATRAAAGDAFAFRAIGGVQVKGPPAAGAGL